MTTRHGDFIWYELLTSDAAAAQNFYSKIFGWTARDSGQQAMDYRLLSMNAVDVAGLMQITGDMKAGGARPVWLGYIAVDDVEQQVAAMTAAGGAVMMPAMDVQGVGRIAMMADPQGAPLYIMRPQGNGTSESFAYDRPRLGHCAWNELVTSDQAGAMRFYSEQFGWQKDGEMEMGPMGTYAFFRRRHTPGMFAGVMNRPAGMPVSMWTFYFRVPDIDAASAQTTALGGQILVGPVEIPGGDFAVNAIDPQGASFAFVGARQKA